MPMRNTIVVPCMVKSSLYCAAVRTVPFASKSWSRMSSASMPPTMKKTSAAAPYMIPIFLWSTVVNQLHTPVVDFGRRRTSGRRGTGVTASEPGVLGTPPRHGPSLQLQEVVGERLRLGARHHRIARRSVGRERRHPDAARACWQSAVLGLHGDHRRCAQDPANQVPLRQLVVPAVEHAATSR